MLEPGVLVDEYRIERVIGVGGMGVVYEAVDTSLANRHVALKLIASQYTEDPDFRARFKREAETQAGVDHPHIITVYRAGESAHGLYIAMRLVRGPSLEQLIGEGRLDPARTARLLTQIAGALDAAHEAGLIHRDIKPSNILVDVRRDHAYLADFGITRPQGGHRLTRTGRAVGTPDYMSPEQFRGVDLTERSDVYSLAAVLFECLGGRVPFPRDSDVAVMYAHLSEPPPRLTESRPDLPAETDEVVQRAMAKDPDERHASATELILDFERALGLPTRPSASSPAVTPPTREAAPAHHGHGGRRDERTTPATPVVAAAGLPETDATRLAGTPVAGAAVSITPPPSAPAAPPEPDRAAAAASPAPATPVGAEAQAPAAVPTVHSVREPTVPSAAAPAGAAEAAPAPRAATAPARAGTRQPVSLAAGALAAALVVAVAAGAFVLGRRGDDAQAGPQTVTAGALRLAAPAGWTRASGPALGLRDAVTIERDAAGGSTRLTAGSSAPRWPGFLPAGFRFSDTGRRDVLRLGSQRLHAFRYEGVRRGTASNMTVYVVPQASSAAVLACSSRPGASAERLRLCEQAVGTLSLDDAKPYPLVVPAAYASTVKGALDRLDRSRAGGLRALRAASTRAGQSQAAADVATAYSTAQSAMRRARPTAYVARVHTPLLTALARARGAYRRMAAAADEPAKPAAYERARQSAARQDAAVRRAVAGLSRVGFVVS